MFIWVAGSLAQNLQRQQRRLRPKCPKCSGDAGDRCIPWTSPSSLRRNHQLGLPCLSESPALSLKSAAAAAPFALNRMPKMQRRRWRSMHPMDFISSAQPPASRKQLRAMRPSPRLHFFVLRRDSPISNLSGSRSCGKAIGDKPRNFSSFFATHPSNYGRSGGCGLRVISFFSLKLPHRRRRMWTARRSVRQPE